MRCTSFYGRLLIAIAMMSVTASSASAGWNELMHKVGVGFKRNNAWPDPFNEADAMAVIMPFEAMKQNGWVLHNTIGPHHFRDGDGALETSGQKSLAWIARQAPASRRQVYIVRAATDQETEARVASVREMLNRYQGDGDIPSIALIDRMPPTASGDWATKVNRAWLDELAPPKLPTSSAAGTASATRQ
jgi:type II secretory pathway pseudopilin PulG